MGRIPPERTVVTAASRFVILAAPRTGSNLLCTLLDSHPSILCHHELFNPRGIFYALGVRDGAFDLGTMEERDRAPLAFLERVWTHPGSACRVGFKMTRGQDDRVMRHVIDDPRVRKIILRRENRLKTFVSHLVAERTDRWEAYGEDEVPPRGLRVTVDVDALREHTALMDQFYAAIEGQLRISRQPWLAMSYETLLSPSEHRRVLGFLDVPDPGTRLEPASVKQNPSDVRERIANLAELESELRGTRFHDELYDTGP